MGPKTAVLFRHWLQIGLVALVGAGVAQAQFLQSENSAEKRLPQAERDTIERLGTLSHLPPGVWHYHTGDVAHGEDPSLNDSDWPVAKPNSKYPLDTLWFREWVQVPKTLNGYDLTGARIWFRFRASVNGPLPQIVYFNGRRVAMGDDLEPIVLFDQARPGDRVLVAVKLLATVDEKRFGGSTMEITFAANRPSPEDTREEFLSAAMLVPSLSTNESTDQATLDKAISQVDMKALDSADQQAFDDSLRGAQETLQALKPMMDRATLHLTGNSHIDAAWLWPWTETVDTVKNTWGTAIQLMNEYPTYTFTQSAAAYNNWMARDYPQINDQIKKRIDQGRWEVVGGMWVEPDLNMPDGESTARSLLIGKRWYQQHYGVDVRIGWNPDSFGYNWQLPQIYKKSGVDYFVTQKMQWSDTNHLPFKLFWWESPDGSKVLAYFPHDYANTNLNPVRLSADLAQAREFAPGLTEMMDLYGVGDHGGGPTRAMLDEGLHWMQPDKVVPKMQFGTAQPYFSDVEKQLAPESKTWDYRTIAQGYQFPAAVEGKISIPTWDDEMYLEYHRGVFTTQTGMKRNLREAPEWTLNAEKLASLAWLDGDGYPGDELTDAWKKITFNDFHDLAAGSGIGVIYKDAQKDFDQVRWETNEVSGRALKTIAARVDTHAASGVPVFVFNPLGWTRSGDVMVNVQMPSAATDVSVLDSRGAVLPSTVVSKNGATSTFHLLVKAHDVPSLGYEVLRVVPGHRPFTSDLRVSGTTLENAALRVVVDAKTGCITSLYDKRAQFETLAAGTCGNELQAFKDTPKEYDAWNVDPGTLDRSPTLLTQADSVEVVEKGPERGVIRVTRHWQNSKFVQDIVLETGSDEAVVVNDIDWHETHVLLKAAFALAAMSPFATYEIPYGTIERPTTRNNSWEKARFEVPAQRWADEGDGQHGFSVINDSKYGYDGVGNLLRLTLLRSPVWPDPNADRGHQHFTYALYPHAGDWKQAMTVRHGYEYNYPLHAMQVEAHTGPLPAEHSFVAVGPDHVVLTAMKKAEDSHALIFHLYEWAGKGGSIELRVPPGATGAAETNLLEKPQGGALPVSGDRVTVPVRPYEIVAVRVDYPEKQ
ncbi:MAG TPA: glycoside hydrolase family 38 C-terminal domain-containing protein [Acidobacteriaceae bacterium]|nr:glycoside hydrolase family 38 C-terminal domain-containing protein [Acidobacteriaceae bacterium]